MYFRKSDAKNKSRYWEVLAEGYVDGQQDKDHQQQSTSTESCPLLITCWDGWNWASSRWRRGSASLSSGLGVWEKQCWGWMTRVPRTVIKVFSYVFRVKFSSFKVVIKVKFSAKVKARVYILNLRVNKVKYVYFLKYLFVFLFLLWFNDCGAFSRQWPLALITWWFRMWTVNHQMTKLSGFAERNGFSGTKPQSGFNLPPPPCQDTYPNYDVFYFLPFEGSSGSRGQQCPFGGRTWRRWDLVFCLN